MKTEYHLVLIHSLKFFSGWVEEFLDTISGEFKYNEYKTLLEVYQGDVKHVYKPFTPYMDRENLRGCRFKSIIDTIGLDGNELSWFNSFVRE